MAGSNRRRGGRLALEGGVGRPEQSLGASVTSHRGLKPDFFKGGLLSNETRSSEETDSGRTHQVLVSVLSHELTLPSGLKQEGGATPDPMSRSHSTQGNEVISPMTTFLKRGKCFRNPVPAETDFSCPIRRPLSGARV